MAYVSIETYYSLLDMKLKKSTKDLIKKSQKRIDQLRKTIQSINQSKQKPTVEPPKPKQEELQRIKVVLSIDSVVKATLAIMGLIGLAYILFYITDVIVLFLMALFLSAAFNPAVDFLESKKIPRPLGIILMYITVLGVVVLVFTSLAPIIATQLKDLAFSVRGYVQNIVQGGQSNSWLMQKIQPILDQLWQNVDQTQIINTLSGGLKEVGTQLSNFAENIIGAILAFFNGLFNTILVLILTFFMILNKHNTNDFFHSLFPSRYSNYISTKTNQVSERIGAWIRGQMLLALAMSVLTLTIFSIMGLNYSLTLAMISGLMEFIPYLGPIITFASAFLIALNQDPVLVLWLFPAYGLIQFVEGNIMVPLILGGSVGLNPIVVLFSLLSGFTLGSKLGDSLALGIVGMIISVPLANIISIFVEDYTGRKK